MTAMSSNTFYDVLGVARDATAAQIKRAYRTRAQKLHPDVSPSPDAAARFAELQNAYEVLSNPNRRRDYDRSLVGAEDPAVPPKAHYTWRNVATEATPEHGAEAGNGGIGGRERTELDDLYDAFFGERSG